MPSFSSLWINCDNQSDMPPTKTPHALRGTIKGSSSQQVVSFTIRASPMPKVILDFILENLEVWKILQHNREVQQGNAPEKDEQLENYGDVVRIPTVTPEHFWDTFSEKCKEAGGEWVNVADKTWAFGPQRAGACLLVDSRSLKPYTSSVSLFSASFSVLNHVDRLQHRLQRTTAGNDSAECDKINRDFDNHIETGFQLATFQGPLCAEPMEGIVYFVEQVDIDRDALGKEIGELAQHYYFHDMLIVLPQSKINNPK